jgi:glycosyltransferase involved in cell wall biosynthesis
VATRRRRILAALYHSYIDTSSGAAISLRDMLEALARRDWEVRVFCGPALDFEGGRTNQQLLQDQGIPFEVYDGNARGEEYSVYMFRKGGVDCGLYLPSRPRERPDRAVGENWLQSYAELLNSWRPDVVVTYVNPQPHKGVFVVARIAEVLGRERPDIRLLVVESRGASDWVGAANPALAGAENLFRMNNTPDPRDYYRVSHVVLMPSVWQESFGRVAAEAMINGIPVLGSTRGALPEVIGDEELLLEIPVKYTPESRELPSHEEVRPWVEAIERLWDDKAYYREVSDRCRKRSALWEPERLVVEFEGAAGVMRCRRGIRL